MVVTNKKENLNTGLGMVSDNFVWQNIGLFPTSQETFCDVYGPHFDSAELNVVSAFENIFYIMLVQLIVDETNNVQQEVLKSVDHFSFHSMIRKWEIVQQMKLM
jgi:hypothetical protein